MSAEAQVKQEGSLEKELQTLPSLLEQIEAETARIIAGNQGFPPSHDPYAVKCTCAACSL